MLRPNDLESNRHGPPEQRLPALGSSLFLSQDRAHHTTLGRQLRPASPGAPPGPQPRKVRHRERDWDVRQSDIPTGLGLSLAGLRSSHAARSEAEIAEFAFES